MRHKVVPGGVARRFLGFGDFGGGAEGGAVGEVETEDGIGEEGLAVQLDAVAQAGVVGDDQRELAVGRVHAVFRGGQAEGREKGEQ